jgi:hypothetical protein
MKNAMKKTVTLTRKIPQTAGSLGQTSANLGKDMRPVASGDSESLCGKKKGEFRGFKNFEIGRAWIFKT